MALSRSLVPVLAAGALLAAGTGALADRPARLDLLRVSGTAPALDHCGAKEKRTVGAETEPMIAVDPRDDDRMVAAWQQDKTTLRTGGAQTDLVGYSQDGGRTWEQVLVPGIGTCTDGTEELLSDPWVSIGAEGNVYLSSLFFPTTDAVGAEAGAPGWVGYETGIQVSVARPEDRRSARRGSLDFDAPLVVQSREEKQFHDRPAVAAHPSRPGVAHLAWITVPPPHYVAKSVVWTSSTTDGGRTWSPRRLIDVPLPPGVIGGVSLDVVDDGSEHGRVLMVFEASNITGLAADDGLPVAVPSSVVALSSGDGGQTWQRSTVLQHDRVTAHAGVSYGPHPALGVARDGTAFVAFPESTSKTTSRLLLSRSEDGGVTWTPPAVVRETPAPTLMTEVAALSADDVAITYYDLRHDTDLADNTSITTDVWTSFSHDGGRTWTERRVTPESFDFDEAAQGFEGTGRFLGHYIGSAATRDGYVTTLPLTGNYASDGPVDLHLALLRPGR